MSSLAGKLASRATLIGLAAVAACAFAAAGILGNHRHGALKVVADVAWNAGLITGLALILVGAAALARARNASRHTQV